MKKDDSKYRWAGRSLRSAERSRSSLVWYENKWANIEGHHRAANDGRPADTEYETESNEWIARRNKQPPMKICARPKKFSLTRPLPMPEFNLRDRDACMSRDFWFLQWDLVDIAAHILEMGGKNARAYATMISWKRVLFHWLPMCLNCEFLWKCL